jgi:D-serine deaminase-like pyridoxal phosphate-dependent protein
VRDPVRRRDSHLAVDGGLARRNRDPGHSLTVQASVISRQSGRVIVDAGSKSVADPAYVTVVGHDWLTVVRFDEEHGVFAARGGSALAAGDSVALVPGYSPEHRELL